MELDITAWIAIYAAIVATGALFLEVRRWYESGARLKISTMPQAQMLSGGQLADETYIVVNVANRGDVGTTITHLTLHYYASWWQRIADRPDKSFIVNTIPGGMSEPLPFYLDSGRRWTGMAKHDEEVERMLLTGDLWVGIVASHRDHTIYSRLKAPKQPKGEPIQ